MNVPRRPKLPFSMFAAPPAARQPPVLQARSRVTDEREIQQGSFVPLAATTLTSSIFSLGTERAWAQCDVYISPPADVNSSSFIRALVYAVNRNVRRALVASGFWSSFAVTQGRVQNTRIASARATCERYEVDLFVVNPWISGDGVPTTIEVTLVASDRAIESEYGVGVTPATESPVVGASLVPGAVLASADPQWLTEIVRVVASNSHATEARFFHVVDRATIAAAAGAAPIHSILVPPLSSVVVGPEVFAGQRFGEAGCIAGGSTTRDTFTEDAANLQWKAWVR